MQTNTKSKRNWVLGITSDKNKTAKNKTCKNWLASRLKTVKEYLQSRKSISVLSAIRGITREIFLAANQTKQNSIYVLTAIKKTFKIYFPYAVRLCASFYPQKSK